MNHFDRQGGKKFGELKAKQASYIDALNRDILASEDIKYVHVAALSQKLDIYKKKFMEFDADHSGDIDFFELKQMLERLGQPRTHLEAKKLLQDVDKQGRGAINYRDFVDMLLGNTLGVGIVFTEEEELELSPPKNVQPKKKRQAPKPPTQKQVSFKEDVKEIVDPPLPGTPDDEDSDPESEPEADGPIVYSAPPSGDPPPYEAGTAVHGTTQPAPERRPIPIITTEVLPRLSQQRHSVPPSQPASGGSVTEVVPPPQAQVVPQSTQSTPVQQPQAPHVQQALLPRTQASLSQGAPRPATTGPSPAQHVHMPHQTPRAAMLPAPTSQISSNNPAPQVFPYHLPYLAGSQAVQGMHAGSNSVHGIQGGGQAVQGVQTYIPCNVPGCTQCPQVYPTAATVQPTYQLQPQMVAYSSVCGCAACMNPAVVSGLSGQVAYSQSTACSCQLPGMTAGYHGYQYAGNVHALNDKMGSISLT